MGKVIAVTNQKGGVGKTTTTVNLAASLALADRRILIVDLDPQGNASSAVGVDKSALGKAPTIYDALLGENTIEEAVKPTEMEGLFVVPATSDLAGAEIDLVSMFSRELKLKSALRDVKEKYDYIFIDCPPSLGLLTVNALSAADSYLVPMQCEYFALEGLSQLVRTVALVRQSLNPELKEEGIVLTMVDTRNNLATEVITEVRRHFGEKVFSTVVPRNVRLSECASHGKPILLYDVDSRGCLAYLNLAKEFLNLNCEIKDELPPPVPRESTASTNEIGANA